jgi:hypothetical protein
MMLVYVMAIDAGQILRVLAERSAYVIAGSDRGQLGFCYGTRVYGRVSLKTLFMLRIRAISGIRMRVDMLWWLRIAAEFHGVSSQTGRIKTTKKGVFVDSEEASAWRTALSISSGSYSGLAIHEPVQRYRNKSVIAPKISSSGKAEHNEIPPDMEELRGLPKSSLLDRNVRPNACCSASVVAQWLASLSVRPWGFRDLALGSYRVRSLRRS